MLKKKWKNKFSTASQLEQVLRHRFTVNLDTCHFSVLFDEPAQAAIDLKKIANAVDTWPIPSKASGKLEFFLEQMIETDSWGRRQEA